MDVILLERIEKLGQMGDIVTVKPGYARNFLLPQNKALRATEANREAFLAQRTQLDADNLENREEATRVAKHLDGLSVIIVRQASESDQLYGSVTTRDIATAITESGVGTGRQQIRLERPIKTLGMHTLRVDLHPEVSVNVVANVARSEEEAKMQERGERVNRDGEVVNIDTKSIEPEGVFEAGAAPDAEELQVDNVAVEEDNAGIENVEATGETPQNKG